MSELMRKWLVLGTASANAGEVSEARYYLERVAESREADPDQQMRAWYILSTIEDDPQKKRSCLENVLAFNPRHPAARKDLAILEGRLDPGDLIDPDHYQAPRPGETVEANGDRFECPNCGSRLSYAPDGGSLFCEYCQTRNGVSNGGEVAGMDFIAGMHTAAGHSHAVDMRAVECQACGVTFLLSAHDLTLTCPYCGAGYHVAAEATQALIPPAGVVPFSMTRDDARQALLAWLKKRRISAEHMIRPVGRYLPLWAFNAGGDLPWTAEEYNSHTEEWVPVSGHKYFNFEDLAVPASSKAPNLFSRLLNEQPLGEVQPYAEEYLASWAAETYSIPLSNAALEARAEIRRRLLALPDFTVSYKQIRRLDFRTTNLGIDSYRLLLMGVWVGGFVDDKVRYAALIHGQTGVITAEEPPGGFRKLMAWLLE